MVLITLNSTLASVSSKGSVVVCVSAWLRCVISHVVCVSAWLRMRHLTCCVCFSLVTAASSHMLCVFQSGYAASSHMLCVFQPGYGCVISHVVCVSAWCRCCWMRSCAARPTAVSTLSWWNPAYVSSISYTLVHTLSQVLQYAVG